ncbi:MAG: methyltransferase domain-containing protein [Chloroflexi bacterium]|nr:methyltransferase domain-containing protein [Chloroflexota bacterium]
MTTAAERWKEQVEAHHAQTEKVRAGASEEDDFWSPIAKQFRDDPSRTDDPVLNQLVSWVDAESTVLDVGGGAGRFAIPLAKRCREVIVADSSSSMLETLASASKEAGVTNVRGVQTGWEEAEIEAEDMVLCAHVLYGIVEIEAFLRKLGEHARGRVVIVSHTVAPTSMASPFWKAVHGEERILLPALPELVPVLWEMDVFPDIVMVPATQQRSPPDRETALTWLRRLTWVAPDSEKDRVLQEELDAVFDAEGGEYVLRRARSEQGIVTWLTD